MEQKIKEICTAPKGGFRVVRIDTNPGTEGKSMEYFPQNDYTSLELALGEAFALENQTSAGVHYMVVDDRGREIPPAKSKISPTVH